MYILQNVNGGRSGRRIGAGEKKAEEPGLFRFAATPSACVVSFYAPAGDCLATTMRTVVPPPGVDSMVMRPPSTPVTML